VSASYTILLSWPSLCQKLSSWWKFDKVMTKNNFDCFLRHGVNAQTSDTLLHSTLYYSKLPT